MASPPSRIFLASTLALWLGGCTPPALKDFYALSMSGTSTGESSTSTGDDTGSTSVMTSEGSGSGTDSASDSTSTASTGDQTSTSAAHTTTDASTTTTGIEAVCGNGIVEGVEECDDANQVADDRCADDCTKNRWVFVSQAIHDTGKFGDLATADNFCQQYALHTGLADDSWKTFIAWLSDSGHDVRDRLYRGRGRYLRTDKVVVVQNGEQFLSGTLDAPINVDEYGNATFGGAVTGTKPDGTAADATHCDDWTSEELFDFSAVEGNISSNTETWTLTDLPSSCASLTSRLYCIEGK